MGAGNIWRYCDFYVNHLKTINNGVKLIDFNELRNVVNGSLLENEPMSKHTSYGIGGPALAYITPQDSKDLSSILKFALENKIPVFLLDQDQIFLFLMRVLMV